MHRGLFLSVGGGLVLALTAFAQAPGGDREPPTILQVQVSRKVVSKIVSKPFDQTEPYTDVIDETPVEGVRRTRAVGDVEFVPDAGRGVMDIIANGASSSREVGRRPFVLVHTATTTSFQARQRLVIDSRGLSSARGSTAAGACITLVKATDYFGDPEATGATMVRLGFFRERERLEGIVAQKVACQAAERHEAKVIEAVDEASRHISTALGFARDVGLPVETLRFASTTQHLQARLSGRAGDDVSVSPVPRPPAQADLSISVHEALVNQAARRLLGGKTVTVSEVLASAKTWTRFWLRGGPGSDGDGFQRIEKVLKALAGETPRLVLAKEDPVTVRLTADSARLEMHIAVIRVGKDGKQIKDLRVRASYRFENGPQGSVAVRQGPVLTVMDAVDKKAGDLLVEGVAALLRMVGEEVFKERMSLGDLAVPIPIEGLESLAAARWDLGGGWITLAWTLPDKASR